MTEPLRILVLGAHPDDADIKVGGTSAKWRRLGHEVKWVSVTDGGAGHQTLRRPALIERRRAEARAAGAILGLDYEVLDQRDGELMPTLEARFQLIRLIRTFKPDLILTHRPNDYHPDHRYTSILVQDAAYMMTVPAICPETPHLQDDPVIMYVSDDFKKPTPFTADLVVDIGDEMPTLVDMLNCHVSQFYEWLPYNSGTLDQVPADKAAGRRWLDERIRNRIRPLADRHRAALLRTYGDEHGEKIEYIEAFEVSEYGSPLDAAAQARLFPFLPRAGAFPTKVRTERWVDMRTDD